MPEEEPWFLVRIEPSELAALVADALRQRGLVVLEPPDLPDEPRLVRCRLETTEEWDAAAAKPGGGWREPSARAGMRASAASLQPKQGSEHG